MMTGRVENLHATLPLILRTGNGSSLTLEFVIDTGFTGTLTLPPAAVQAMGLPLLHRMPADLADGSTIFVAVHAATIV